jgi:hypothetical protein
MLVDLIVGIVVTTSGIRSLVLPVGHGINTSFAYVLYAFIAILGLLYVGVSYGLWKARPWAWLLGLWAGVVYVVLGVLAINPLFLLSGIVNLFYYYFARADLKRYLGKVRP